MNVFYNKEGVGDTLIISLKPIDYDKMKYEKRGELVRIYNEESNETYGYNLFHATKYFDVKASNRAVIDLDPVFLRKVNDLLGGHGFDEKLEADFAPKFVVGYVEEIEKHPKADKLSICQVDVGFEKLQIVCGAPNVDAGQKVVVARIGAVMPSGLVIQPSELRGIASNGMICSARELGLPNAPEKKGILVLDDSYQVGAKFEF